MAGADDLLARLAAAPDEAGLFLDFDGVLAPIVARPEDAAPPPETRAELERLVGRYALVAVVSGRAGEDVQARVAVDGVVVVGSHGLELEPEAERWRQPLAAFAAAAPWPAREIEVKGLAVAFHFRELVTTRRRPCASSTRSPSRRGRQGLVARYGRKVLEVLPPVGSHKGTAVRRSRRGARAAPRARGRRRHDRPRLLRRARRARGRGARRRRVAEAPSALLEAADLVVDSTSEFLALLRQAVGRLCDTPAAADATQTGHVPVSDT